MREIIQFFKSGATDAHEEAHRISDSEFRELVLAIDDNETNTVVWLRRCSVAIFAALERFREGDAIEECTPYEQNQLELMIATYIIRQTELARERWPSLAPGEPYDWEN